MQIAFHGMGLKKEFLPFFHDLCERLHGLGHQLFLSRELFQALQKAGKKPAYFQVLEGALQEQELDFVFSVGGDGTMLDTVAKVGAAEIPIIGINTGRLGFLATVAKDQLDQMVLDLMEGQYAVESRTLLEVSSDRTLFKGIHFGLNEFTIHKRDTSSMITVHTYVDDLYLNSYWADGLIVATPTGSTGYSLSCGGPLITPGAKNFVLTPVSPHNLNVRPIIVSDESVLRFTIEGRSKKFLVSLDSRSTAVDAGISLQVQKAPFCARLVKFSTYHYFDTLREKLNWGYDMRN
ncbi:MAG: NAD kinase [Nitritalea sp.]